MRSSSTGIAAGPQSKSTMQRVRELQAQVATLSQVGGLGDCWRAGTSSTVCSCALLALHGSYGTRHAVAGGHGGYWHAGT
jgi:hypothetical protein